MSCGHKQPLLVCFPGFGPQLFVSLVLQQQQQQQQHCGDVWSSVTRAVSGGLFLEQQWQEKLWGARSCSSLGSRWFWVLQKLCHYTSSLFVKFVFIFVKFSNNGFGSPQPYVWGRSSRRWGAPCMPCHFYCRGCVEVCLMGWWVIWGCFLHFVLEGSEVMSAMKGKKSCILVNGRRQGTNNLRLPTRNHPSSDPDCEVFR
jgi:hypothetical protein